MRVLMMGPWGIGRPRHGGQIRADAIVAAYRRRGHDVTFIGVVDPSGMAPEDIQPHDVALDDVVMGHVARSGLPWEISLWNGLAEVPEHFARFARIVDEFRPDVIE